LLLRPAALHEILRGGGLSITFCGSEPIHRLFPAELDRLLTARMSAE